MPTPNRHNAVVHHYDNWIRKLKLQRAKNSSCCIHSICLTPSLVKFQVVCGIVVKYGFQFLVFKNGYVLQIRLVYGMTGISLCKLSCIIPAFTVISKTELCQTKKVLFFLFWQYLNRSYITLRTKFLGYVELDRKLTVLVHPPHPKSIFILFMFLLTPSEILNCKISWVVSSFWRF